MSDAAPIASRDPASADVADALYAAIRSLPIVSPHGHTVPAWFATNRPFVDPAELLIVPDHYFFRLLYSRGVPLRKLGGGVPAPECDSRAIFRTFAAHWLALLGTPSRGWLTHVLRDVFGIDLPSSLDTAAAIHDTIAVAIASEPFRPRALLERFGIEALATTDGALDTLDEHATFAASGHPARLLPTFRPDIVLNATLAAFREDVARPGELRGEDTATVVGYRAALVARRVHFRARGARDRSRRPGPRDRTPPCTDARATADTGARGFDLARGRRPLARSHADRDGGIVRARRARHAAARRRASLDQRRGPRKLRPERGRRHFAAHRPGARARRPAEPSRQRCRADHRRLHESACARELSPMAGHWPALSSALPGGFTTVRTVSPATSIAWSRPPATPTSRPSTTTRVR